MNATNDKGPGSGYISGTPPWSVDPVVHVDRVHVIESLPPGEQSWYYRTGAHLFDELRDVCADAPVEPHFHVVQTRQQLTGLLRCLVAEAEAGHFPLLHFETHGIERGPGSSTTSIGLALASREFMAWHDLAPYFTAINEATRLNLIVFMSACYGLDVAKLIQPLQRASARIFIGPMRPIEVPEIDRATRAFYRTLLRERDGSSAVLAMNATLDPKREPFLALSAEWMFLEILKLYYNEATTESQIAARVEAKYVEMILQGIPLGEASRQREAMRAFHHDRKGLFDATYRRFFFVDKFPEITDRFRMTFEACFHEARSAP
jgi:hypothetical protein